MNTLKPDERVAHYNSVYWEYPHLHYEKGWIYGVWMLGQNYKGSGFYGSYPPTYLDRIYALFPETEIGYGTRVLHLFSGSIEKEPGKTRFDINPENDPDVVGSAEEVSKHFPKDTFHVIISDPPYSKEHAEKYGYPMVNRKNVFGECYKILKPGWFMIWLDTRMPMWKKEQWKLFGTIGIIRSSNHLVRMVTLWERLK